MPRINRAVMSAEQPALEQGNDAMNSRQWLMRWHLGAEDDMRVVIESVVNKRHVYWGSIRSHLGAPSNVFTHERQKRIHGRSLDAAQSNPSEALGFVHLDGYGNSDQVTAIMALGTRTLVLDAKTPPEREVCLIDLHRARQQVAFGANHCSPKPVQHRPRSLVAV